jgi:hypothetical protein
MLSVAQSSITKKTRSATFRINENTVDKLGYEATKHNISLNMLVNQMFDQYVNWDSMSSSVNLISFPKPLLVKIMDKLTEEEVIDITKRHFEEDVEDIILRTRGKFSAESFMEALELWMKSSDITYRRIDNVGKQKYIIQHNMSKKWALFLSGIVKLVIETLEGKKVETQIDKNSCLISFDRV